MSRAENRLAPRQMELSEEFSVVLPHLSHIAHGEELMAVLPMLRTWRERPASGPCFLADIEQNTHTVFDPDTWILHEPKSGFYPEGRRVNAACIVLPTQLHTDEQIDLFEHHIHLLLQKLKSEGVLVFYETEPYDDDARWRQDIFHRAELVDIQFHHIEAYGAMIWEGRHAKTRSTHETDLLRLNPEDPMKSIRWNARLAAMIQSYEEQGYVVVDAAEIVNTLHHARNAIDVLSSLKEGFGFGLQANCGCTYLVRVNGEIVSAAVCDDHEGLHTSYTHEVPYQPHHKPPERFLINHKIDTGVLCFDCGAEFYKIHEPHFEKRKKGLYVRTVLHCPNCGEIKDEGVQPIQTDQVENLEEVQELFPHWTRQG